MGHFSEAVRDDRMAESALGNGNERRMGKLNHYLKDSVIGLRFFFQMRARSFCSFSAFIGLFQELIFARNLYFKLPQELVSFFAIKFSIILRFQC